MGPLTNGIASLHGDEANTRIFPVTPDSNSNSEIRQEGFDMKLIRGLVSYLQIAGELLVALWRLKRWWAVPMVIILVAFALLLMVASSTGIAPFIYTLF